MPRYKLSCNMPVRDVIIHGGLWGILLFVTAGVAGIFLLLWLPAEILNRTEFVKIEE